MILAAAVTAARRPGDDYDEGDDDGAHLFGTNHTRERPQVVSVSSLPFLPFILQPCLQQLQGRAVRSPKRSAVSRLCSISPLTPLTKLLKDHPGWQSHIQYSASALQLSAASTHAFIHKAFTAACLQLQQQQQRERGGDLVPIRGMPSYCISCLYRPQRTLACLYADSIIRNDTFDAEVHAALFPGFPCCFGRTLRLVRERSQRPSVLVSTFISFRVPRSVRS